MRFVPIEDEETRRAVLDAFASTKKEPQFVPIKDKELANAVRQAFSQMQPQQQIDTRQQYIQATPEESFFTKAKDYVANLFYDKNAELAKSQIALEYAKKYDISPSTAERMQNALIRYESLDADEKEEKAKYMSAIKEFDRTGEIDTWYTTIPRAIATVPFTIGKAVGGLLQAIDEKQASDFTDFVASMKEVSREEAKRMVSQMRGAPDDLVSRKITDTFKEIESKVSPKTEPGSVFDYLNELTQMAVNNGAYITAAILTKNPAFALLPIGLQQKGEKYLQLRDKGVEPDKAQIISTISGISESATELIPTLRYMKPNVKFLERYLSALLPETSGELINTTVDAMMDKIYITPDMTPADYANRMFRTAVMTALNTGAMSGTSNLAHSIVLNLNTPTEIMETFEKSFTAAVKDNKTREEAFKEAVNEVRKTKKGRKHFNSMWNAFKKEAETAWQLLEAQRTEPEQTTVKIDARELISDPVFEDDVATQKELLRQQEIVSTISNWTKNNGIKDTFSVHLAEDADTSNLAWYNRKEDIIYINTKAVETPEQALNIFKQELINHRGVFKILSEAEQNKVFTSVYETYRIEPAMSEIIETYGIDKNRHGWQAKAGMEYFAHHMGSVFNTQSLWGDIKAMIKDLLRRIGLDINYTEDDYRRIVKKSLQNLRSNYGEQEEIVFLKDKKKKEKSLYTIVKEFGGLDPDKLRQDYNWQEDIAEAGLIGVTRKGGRTLDDLATELKGLGLLPEPPQSFKGNDADYLLELLKERHREKIPDIERQIDEQEKQYVKELIRELRNEGKTEAEIDASIRELQESIQKEVIDTAIEELDAETENILSEFISEDELDAQASSGELFDTTKTFSLSEEQGVTPKTMAESNIIASDRLFEVEKASIDELYNRLHPENKSLKQDVTSPLFEVKNATLIETVELESEIREAKIETGEELQKAKEEGNTQRVSELKEKAKTLSDNQGKVKERYNKVTGEVKVKKALEINAKLNAEYQKAINIIKGAEWGLKQGKKEGKFEGYVEGYVEGGKKAFKKGIETGLKEGKAEGFQQGAVKGTEWGLKQGFKDGVIEARRLAKLKAAQVKMRQEVKKLYKSISQIVKEARKVKTRLTQEYKDAIIGVAEGRFDLRGFIENMKDIGDSIFIDPKAIEIYSNTNAEDMTLEQLRNLHDILKSLRYQGLMSRSISAYRDKVGLEDTVLDIRETIKENFEKQLILNEPDLPQPPSARRGGLGSISKVIDTLQAGQKELKRVEYILMWLDGFKDLGKIWAYIFKPIVEAEKASLIRSIRISNELKSAFDLIEKDLPKIQKKRDVASKDGRRWTKEEVIMIALNSGNEGNIQRLIKGYAFKSVDDIKDLTSTLNQNEKEFVNRIFKLINSQRDEINAVYRKMTGSNMPIVEGNYFPIITDKDMVKVSKRDIISNDLMEEGFYSTFVSKYFTEQRVGGEDAPLLAFEAIAKHLVDTNHFITHALAVRDVQKIIRHPVFKETVTAAVGKHAYNQFMPWLKHVAVINKDNAYGFLNYFRKNAVVAFLAFALSVISIQLVAITQAAPKFGMFKLLSNSIDFFKEYSENKEFIYSRSPYMIHRTSGGAFDTDLAKAIGEEIGKISKNDRHLNKLFFKAFTLFDSFVSLPVWLTAYNEGIKKFNGDEQAAVHFADQAVRTTQSSGSRKDLPKIQSSHGNIVQAAIMFYTFFSSTYNELAQAHNKKQLGQIGYGGLINSYWWCLVLPALITVAFRNIGEWGDDEPEEILGDVGKGIAAYGLGTIPIVGTLASSLLGGYRYRPSPILTLPDDFRNMLKAIKDEDFGDALYYGTMVSGILVKNIPARQITLTADFLWNLIEEGETEPMRLFFKPSKKKED